MGLIELASGNSVWRGMDYYKNKKVGQTPDNTRFVPLFCFGGEKGIRALHGV